MPARPYETLTEAEWTQVDHIHEMLDDGEVEAARLALDELLRKRPEHPDLRIEDATLKLEANQPKQALAALAGAERSAGMRPHTTCCRACATTSATRRARRKRRSWPPSWTPRIILSRSR